MRKRKKLRLSSLLTSVWEQMNFARHQHDFAWANIIKEKSSLSLCIESLTYKITAEVPWQIERRNRIQTPAGIDWLVICPLQRSKFVLTFDYEKKFPEERWIDLYVREKNCCEVAILIWRKEKKKIETTQKIESKELESALRFSISSLMCRQMSVVHSPTRGTEMREGSSIFHCWFIVARVGERGCVQT